ncbi:AAA family ATPase, partial [Kitasatospora sp. MBT63]
MGQPAFVGRTAELDVVAQAAHKAAAGEPSLLIVEAAAGIGKTALVRRAIEGLEGFSVWWASCDPAEQDWPFSVVEQWLRQADPRSEANSMVTDRGLGPHVPPVMVGARLVELLSTAQEVGPVIVVVDDVHWADEASLTAVGFMLRRLRADRVLVIATARTEAGAGAAVDGLEGAVPPARAAQWRRLARGTPRVRDLPLEGLPQQAVAQIVETAGVRGAASQALAKRLWELTGGHPLYLRSILAANTADTLIDQDAVVLVSASLEGAVRQMLARLPAPARAMAEALAVLDAPVPPAVAGTVAGLEGNPVQALEPL